MNKMVNGEPILCNRCGSYRHIAKNCMNSGKSINPIGVGGVPSTCKSCGSYRHYLKDCEERWEFINKALEKVHFNEKVDCNDQQEDYENDDEYSNDLCFLLILFVYILEITEIQYQN